MLGVPGSEELSITVHGVALNPPPFKVPKGHKAGSSRVNVKRLKCRCSSGNFLLSTMAYLLPRLPAWAGASIPGEDGAEAVFASGDAWGACQTGHDRHYVVLIKDDL